MPQPIRPLLISTSLLVASHLGIPGGVGAEPEAVPVAVEGAEILACVEESQAAVSFVRESFREDGSETAEAPDAWVEFFGHPTDNAASAATGAPDPQPAPRLPAVAATPVPPPVEPTSTYQILQNDHVRQFLDQFQTGYRRAIVERWLTRSGRYLPMILEVFRQKGLPEELVFTAMIESGFNPVAVSRAGAKGLWQFMAPTARRYGLRVDRWLDERLDPEKSTVAAANYLRDLYAMFGSWELVQAAYNAGEMKVLRAIQGAGTRDFWKLTRSRLLRDETKNFVPAIHAATLIGQEPEQYGFDVTPEEPLRYEQVTVAKGTGLKHLAALSGIPLDELVRLNSELRLGRTPPDGTYSVKVPLGSGAALQAGLDREAEARKVAAASRAAGRSKGKGHVTPAAVAGFHVVQARETVSGIARQYRVSVEELARWNDLDNSARIFPGDRLRVAWRSPRAEEPEQGGFR